MEPYATTPFAGITDIGVLNANPRTFGSLEIDPSVGTAPKTLGPVAVNANSCPENMFRPSESRSALVTLTVDDVMPSGTEDEAGWLEDFERRVSETATLAAVYLGRGVSVQIRSSKGQSSVVAGGNAPDPVWHYLALLEVDRVDATPKPRKRISGRWAA